jgi:hypothetical protein
VRAACPAVTVTGPGPGWCPSHGPGPPASHLCSLLPHGHGTSTVTAVTVRLAPWLRLTGGRLALALRRRAPRHWPRQPGDPARRGRRQSAENPAFFPRECQSGDLVCILKLNGFKSRGLCVVTTAAGVPPRRTRQGTNLRVTGGAVTIEGSLSRVARRNARKPDCNCGECSTN